MPIPFISDKKEDRYNYHSEVPFFITDEKYSSNSKNIIVSLIDTKILYIDCSHTDVEIILNGSAELDIHIIGGLSNNKITIFSYNTINELNIFGERVQEISIKANVKNLLVESYIYNIKLPRTKINNAVFIIEPSIVTFNSHPSVENLISTEHFSLRINYKTHYDINKLVSIDGKYDIKNIPSIVKNIVKYIL